MNKEPMKQIIARLDRLEKAVFEHGSKTGREKKREISSREDLPSQILKLRDQGFFSEPKIPKEVHDKLKTKYHCELNRVTVALLRFHRRRKLRQSSKVVG